MNRILWMTLIAPTVAMFGASETASAQHYHDICNYWDGYSPAEVHPYATPYAYAPVNPHPIVYPYAPVYRPAYVAPAFGYSSGFSIGIGIGGVYSAPRTVYYRGGGVPYGGVGHYHHHHHH